MASIALVYYGSVERSNMQVIRFRDPQSFLDACRVVSASRRGREQPDARHRGTWRGPSEKRPIWQPSSDGADVVACAVRTPPRTSRDQRGPNRPAIACLVADLVARYPDLAGVHGPEPDVTAFAEVWAQHTGVVPTRGTRQRMFEIREAPQLEEWPSGRLRVADERDLPARDALERRLYGRGASRRADGSRKTRQRAASTNAVCSCGRMGGPCRWPAGQDAQHAAYA